MPNSDLISRDSVLKGIEELQKSPWYNAGKEPSRDFPYPHLEYIARTEAVEIIRYLCIKQEPAVDAEPVRHGRWTTARTWRHDGEWYCSVCDYEPQVFENSPYCPMCGSKMDGGINEDH